MTAAPAIAGTAPGAPAAGAVLRVVVVNGSPNQQSKTMGLVDAILSTLAELVPFEASRIDVYRLGPGFTGAIERDDVAPEIEQALRSAEQADLLIAATPVFRGSYPGMFKHFFDLIDQYAWPTSSSCSPRPAGASTTRSFSSMPCGRCSASSRR